MSIESQNIHCYACEADWDLYDEDLDETPVLRDLIQLANILVPPTPERQIDTPSTSLIRSYTPGLCGLRNLGNTCYMNAALQCLSNCPPVVDFFLTAPDLYAYKREPFVYDFANFIKIVWNVFAPNNLLADLWATNPLFRGFGQHDSHEAVSTIIDSLHELTKEEDVEEYQQPAWIKAQEERERKEKASSKPNQAVKPQLVFRSIISAMFEGTLRSRVHCHGCNRLSDTPQPCVGISVNIPKEAEELDAIASRKAALGIPSNGSAKRGIWAALTNFFSSPSIDLLDCLHGFCCEDELTGADKYLCEHCKSRQNAHKSMLIAEPPEILPIHLKRFRHVGYWGSKVGTHITFPLENLDISPFCTPITVGNKEVLRPPVLYDLAGLIRHTGSLGGGHYYAFAKNRETGRWYRFDDSQVYEVSASEVKEEEAYVLFYVKKLSEERKKETRAVEAARQALTANSEVRYVSKFWYYKFCHFENPGPIRNTGILCKHYLVHSQAKRRLSSLLEALPVDVYEALVKRFGGRGLDLNTATCTRCLDKQALKKKREIEHATIKQLDRTEIGPDECWYIIPCAWLSSWINFVSKKTTDEPPGPLDTNTLLLPDGTPKPGLERRVHYRGITKQVWEYFTSIYGSGPPIRRKEIDIYGPEASDSGNEEEEEERDEAEGSHEQKSTLVESSFNPTSPSSSAERHDVTPHDPEPSPDNLDSSQSSPRSGGGRARTTIIAPPTAATAPAIGFV